MTRSDDDRIQVIHAERAALAAFTAAWETGDCNALAAAFTGQTTLRSSAHGEGRGGEEIATLLAADHDHDHAPNAPSASSAPTTSSVATEARQPHRLHLGRHPAGADGRGPAASAGDLRRDPWRGPSAPRQPVGASRYCGCWRLGDPTPTVVSELNSPWAQGLEHSPPRETA
ncbi:hypothetical protein [Streptomyces acidicola]|uniref:hypothetical protein n=1 Tax=Streptomyces acidicola TaxID=2596892 RepID=UPI0037FE2D08